MAAIANSVEWLVRKPCCCGLSIQLLVTKEYNLVNGWFKVDLVGDVKVFWPALSQYNLNPFFSITDLINCVGYLLQ